MDDAKTAADGVEVAKDRTVVEVSEDHDVHITAQADQAQSKEKHESVEKEAGFAAACEVRSAVGKDVSQAPIAVEEAPKAEEEQIGSKLMPTEAIENMEVDEAVQNQALRNSVARMSAQNLEGEGKGEQQSGNVGSPGSNTSLIPPKTHFESSGLLSLGSVEFEGSLRVHAFYVMHCMYTQYSGLIACACN